ncbi:MAG TPA: rhodanese-like domain-containing protein [Longimicrobiaceae bacterium]
MNPRTVPPVVTAGQLAQLLDGGADVRLLDVRTPGEYEAAHIPGAYNVPLDTLGEHAAEIRAHVDEPVVLVCQSGARARRAEEALRGAGMPNLHVLDGGMNGWIAAGKPASRGSERVSLERQVRVVAGSLAAAGGLLAVLASPWFGLLSAFVGGGLVFAGVTDTCGMAMLLSKLPYNRPAGCDVDAMVRALTAGSVPAGLNRAAAAAAPAARSCTS